MNISTSFQRKLSSVLSLFSLLISLSHAADTISTNGSLSGDETLISDGGNFELGFFQPGNSSQYYIGIWYKKIPGKAVVWVANRDKPISDKYSATLKILNDGNLILVKNDSSSLVWSTELDSPPNTSEPVQAALLDDGNLVLQVGSNLSDFLWQSFDYPTDTLMAGAKLGLKKKSKWSRVLTSWKNSEDPSPGLYSIERDPNASQFIMLWNRTDLYWKSGLWVPSQRIFTQIPELRFLKTQFYSFDYIDDENESYITYSIKNASIVTRLVMDTSGQIKQLTWLESTQQWVLFWSQPGQQCEVQAYCGAFGTCNQTSLPYCHCLEGFKPNSISRWSLGDFSGGCARKTELMCGDEDKFLANPSMVFPEHPQLISASSIEECEMACEGNCSCAAYAYDANRCSIWSGDLLNSKQLSDSDPSGRTLYTRLATKDVERKSNKKLVIGILLGLCMGLMVLLGLVCLVYFKKKWSLLKAAKSMQFSLTRFTYRDLQYATRNFSHKLGGGGFGSVFKGTLPDSTVIAVKKLETIAQSQGEKQFRAEVSAIGTIQHVNLVQLRGFCSQEDKRLLVYEFMQNGSLETHLFKSSEATSLSLSWKVRYQIAIGIAKGLDYLHEKCRECIIHCDIKPENILLDIQFCPKIADFGLAKLMGREFSRVLTTIRGTRGYLAPEWISGLAITAKADVYSYGMMLFELVSGRRNTQQTKQGKVEFFPTWAMINIIKGEDVLGILDPVLEGKADRDEVMRMCKLACWCIQDEENQRPSMGQAIQVLEGFFDVDMPLLPRSLRMFADDYEESFMSPSEFLLSLESMGSPYDSASSSAQQGTFT